MSKGRIPEELIEEIKDRSDIVAVIESYLPLQKKGRNYWGLCPFHLEDTPSFSVSPDKQIYYCFGCHKGGNSIHFVMEHENISFPDAVRKLGDRLGIAIPEEEMTTQQKQFYDEKKRLIVMNEEAVSYYGENLKKHPMALDYLLKRGVSEEMIARFSLGFADDGWEGVKTFLKAKGFTEPEMIKAGIVSKADSGRIFDRFRNRLMFPIADVKGNTIAFVGRIIDDSAMAKYVNTEGTILYHKGKTLYGLHLAHSVIRQEEEAILMEGNLDVISAHQFGVKNAIAPQGTALTEDQAKTLRRYCKKIYLAYDSDTAGQKATLKNMDILIGQGFRVYVMEMPKNLDPDDVFHRQGREAWDELKKKSLSYMEYKIKVVMKDRDLSKAEEKADIVTALGPSLFAIKDPIEQREYIRRLGEMLQIEEGLLHMDMQKKAAMNRTDLGHGVNFAPPKDESLKGAKEYLLRMAMEHKAIFDDINAEEGWDFLDLPLHSAIIDLIQKHYDTYSWRVRDLPELAEEDLSKSILSMLLQPTPVIGDKSDTMLADCRRRIRREVLQKELEDVKFAMKNLKNMEDFQEEKRLLQKFDKLQKELRDR